MNMLVQKLPIGKLLGGCVIAWGVVLGEQIERPPSLSNRSDVFFFLSPATTAAGHNFVSLMVVRFLLGWFEAAVQPCFLVMTSSKSLRVLSCSRFKS